MQQLHDNSGGRVMEEEETRKKKAAFTIGQDLSQLSVDELGEMIEFLKEEIARIEETRKSKSDHLSAAEALFKS
ncbi:MAG: DUF1192 domain-containing protein [Pseudomonadota bacterium]